MILDYKRITDEEKIEGKRIKKFKIFHFDSSIGIVFNDNTYAYIVTYTNQYDGDSIGNISFDEPIEDNKALSLGLITKEQYNKIRRLENENRIIQKEYDERELFKKLKEKYES